MEDLGADSVVIRMVVKTKPGAQWTASRVMRERIKAAFDDAGIEIPFAQRTVWVATVTSPRALVEGTTLRAPRPVECPAGCPMAPSYGSLRNQRARAAPHRRPRPRANGLGAR